MTASRRGGSVTSRAAILGVVVSFVVVIVAVPVRTYLSQHSLITQTEQDQAAQRHRIDLLTQQVARDNDPAQVEEQARLRLQLVMPGETDYIVIPTPPKKTAPPPKDRPTALVPAGVSDQTWFNGLWSSVTAAGTTAPLAPKISQLQALMAVTPHERDVVAAQLGRTPRAMHSIAHRCTCGLPDVVETSPRLEDGTPFPTLFYLTCPRAASSIGTLEASGLMSEMTDRIKTDPSLAAAHLRSHQDYLARRDAMGTLPGNPGAGGMPTRVKCLHVLVAHSLAVGPGIDVLGDEALAMLPEWGARGTCVNVVDPS